MLNTNLDSGEMTSYLPPRLICRGEAIARTSGAISASMEPHAPAGDPQDRDPIIDGTSMTLDPATGEFDVTETADAE
jgi:hypothetical protein